MGVYVYQVTKGKFANVDGQVQEIGVLKYYTKPYFDIWQRVEEGHSKFFSFDKSEKKIAKSYRFFFARQARVNYRKYVVYEFGDYAKVYEMPNGATWSYDVPTIGRGVVGVLRNIAGHWFVVLDKKEQKIA